MESMKKLLVLTMIILMSFSIFGCQSDKEKAEKKQLEELRERLNN